MPISAKRFTELRLAISDLLQRSNWSALYETCGTSDVEQAKIIAGIFAMYDPSKVWRFVDYVAGLPVEVRRQRRDSTSTVCLVLGKIGHTNTKRSLSNLRVFLADDHMLRSPVEASLANLWVLDTRTTERVLFNSWIVRDEDNDDLQEIAVKSSEFLTSRDPDTVAPFLGRVARMVDSSPRFKPASRAATELLTIYVHSAIVSRQKLRKMKRKSERKPKIAHARKKNRR